MQEREHLVRTSSIRGSEGDWDLFELSFSRDCGGNGNGDNGFDGGRDTNGNNGYNRSCMPLITHPTMHKAVTKSDLGTCATPMPRAKNW